MHIDNLPLVPLVKIFSYIDDFSDKIALERVCRKWHQTVHLDWEQTKTCQKPLNDRKILGLVLKRCGKWLNELWLQNVGIDEKMVRQMAKRMNRLKHLKLSKCQLDGPSVNSITELFGQQLYSFILNGVEYHPNMRRLIENKSSKLEHLSFKIYSAETLPTKLPNNLKSFSLDTFRKDSTLLLLNMARDCNNLKILHLEIGTLFPDLILAIGNIKSLVYLNLAVDYCSIANGDALQNLICRELPNLKALNINIVNIGGYCSEEMISKMMSNISRDRPDLVQLNVCSEIPRAISNDKCENLVLKKLIKEAIDGGNEPSFLDDWWME